MNESMTPVQVRFTPDAEEVAKLKLAMTPFLTTRYPLWLACVFGASQFAGGAISLTRHGFAAGSAFSIFDTSAGVVQMCLGAAWAPLYYLIGKRALARALTLEPGVEIDLTLDDTGILAAAPQARLVLWTEVTDVRDFGEAFVVSQRRGPSLPIFKRALRDRGAELWAALDAKLSARRYLVRSTLGPPTIVNRSTPAPLW